MSARRCPRSRRSAWGGLLSAALATSLLTACAAGPDAAPDSSPNAQAPTGAASAPASPQSPDPTSSGGIAGTDGTHTDTPSPAVSSPVVAGGEVPESGSGRTTPQEIPGTDTKASSSKASGRVVRYTVEVEGGLEDLAVGFPQAVRTTLTDDRGWETKDRVRFVAVSPEERRAGAETDIRIRFASPTLTDAVCAPLRTNGRLSCHDNGDVMINAWRWVNGADTYGDDLAAYRIYLVNHEVGHSIGHGHVDCPGRGQKAPVMLQQTLRLNGCKAQPYPVR